MKIKAIIRLVSLPAAPAPVAGRCYFNSATAKWQVYDGAGWVDTL